MLNHLWQSTLFLLVAALLTLALRTNYASARHSIWFAASLKFLLPFSLLIGLGKHLVWLTGVAAAPHWTVIIDNIAQPASIQSVLPHARTLPTALSNLGYLLAAGWLVGFSAVVIRWAMRWREITSCLHAAERIDVGASVETRSSLSILEPGVVGIRHPVLLLPSDFAQRLPPEQMRTILAHEISHVRRRDNLTATLHMAVEALFWFYPLVWWLGARLIAERERACDEAVVQSGHDPKTYGEAILNVCKHYVASPLACASGVSGAELKRRIEHIVANCVPGELSGAKRILLATVALVAITGPVMVGLFGARVANAQAEDTFEALHGHSDVSAPPPGLSLDARTSEKDNDGNVHFTHMRIYAGTLWHLTANRAVAPFRGGQPIFTKWRLNGNIKLHLPQGDLYADHASLHFEQKNTLLVLDTARGSWVAASPTDAGAGIKGVEGLAVRYDIPNNTVEIGSPTDME